METTSSSGRSLGWIATVIVIIGAINWALVGLFKVDVVASLFGTLSTLSRLIYVVIGLAGLYLIYFARTLSREAPEQRFGRPRATA